MKNTIIVLSLLALFSVGGCSDDDNPAAVNSDPLLFVIDVNVRIVPQGASYMEVHLAMENPGQIPSFQANGEWVSSFTLYGDIVSGYLILPFADSIEFTVHSLNREISGSFELPRRPDVVICNGLELVQQQGNVMEASGRYEFSWSGGNADYYDCFMELYDQELGGVNHWGWIEGEMWTVEESIGRPFGCTITAKTGSRGEPGENPIFSSSWAKGYFFARSNGTWYYFTPSSSQQRIKSDISAMDRLEKLLN